MKTTTVFTRFYSGRGFDANGRTLSEILSWNDNRLETVHDYIQWPEPSRFNSDAPVLTAEDIQAFLSVAKLRSNLLRSFARMLKFYGFTMGSVQGKVVIGNTRVVFRRQAEHWLTPQNHNLLRITRILKCLTMLGLREESRAFLAALQEVEEQYPGSIEKSTFRYWKDAVKH